MTINKFLQRFILGGLFLILFLPLYVSNVLFFPFITGKGFAFRILVEILLGAWIILALRDASYRPKKSLILSAAAMFLGVMAVADALSENPFKSFWSNYERMEGFVTLAHLFAYFLIAGSVLTARNLWERFWQTSLGVNVILVGYGMLQLLGKLDIHQGSSRIDATFGNATYFAVYLLFHTFIAAFLAVRHRGALWARWAYGAIIIVNLFALYHTATRGAILGLLGGVFITAILIAIFEKENLRLKKYTIVVLVITLLVPASLFLLRNNEWVNQSLVLSRFTSISLHEKTTESRFMVWNMAWQGFRERPIFGWGQESFNFVFNKYYDPKMYDQEPWFDRAHNVFFDWLIAGGILGLLAYLSLFGAILYYVWRRNDSSFSVAEKSILTGLLAGYFFNNLFVFDNLISYILFFSLLAYVHGANAVPGLWFKKQEGVGISSYAQTIIQPAVLVATIFVLYAVNYQPLAANLNLISALQRQSSLSVNLDYFKKAIARNSFGTPEAREQLAIAASNILATSASQDIKSSFISTAVQELENQIKRVPQDARYQLFTGSLLNQIGNYDQAIVFLKNAQALTPQKQQVYFEMANSYLNKGDYRNAVDVTKTAYELDPDYDNARMVYAMALIYKGDKAQANEILAPIEEKPGLDFQFEQRLLKAYLDTKDYKSAERMLNGFVATDPKNYQYHLSLGAVYLQEGQRQKAIGELQKAIDANPDFKTQGEYYINEIKAGRNP
jgi:O-antigen ligase/Flp pilus assembly protein TadD